MCPAEASDPRQGMTKWSAEAAPTKGEAETVRDPVCGMEVDRDAGAPSHAHEGRRFHFCSERCRARFAAEPDAFVAATDPVCGMKVDRASARRMTRHAGAPVYFCSARCQERFEADPDHWLGERPAPEAMPAGTIYTCPMHPEIEQVGPGDCPICGMALEPKGVRRPTPAPIPSLSTFAAGSWSGRR